MFRFVARSHLGRDRPENPATDWLGAGLTRSGQVEHREECCIHSPLFFRCEMTGQTPKPPYVDSSCLFDEHAGGN